MNRRRQPAQKSATSNGRFLDAFLKGVQHWTPAVQRLGSIQGVTGLRRGGLMTDAVILDHIWFLDVRRGQG